MDARFWLIQAFNGISYGALLFLVGSGLSLIFGVMRKAALSRGRRNLARHLVYPIAADLG